jgi:hypothetical protein
MSSFIKCAPYAWLCVLTLGCTGAVASPGAGNRSNANGGTGAEGGAATPNGAAGTGATTAGSAGTGATGGGATGSEVTEQPTWRLTNTEYANTLRDLLGIDVTTPLDPDGAAAGYTAGLGARDAAVSGYHAAALSVSSQTAQLLKLVPCDASTIAATPADCAAKFIDAIGPKAFRRPMDADTRTALTGLFGVVNAKFGFNAGVQALTEQILQSPYFLYHLELEEQSQGPGQVAVTGYSMASRLSYLIWASMPDDALFAKAAAGQLSTATQVASEATRMLADQKARPGLRNFYEQWLKVRSIPLSKSGKYAAAYDPQSLLASFDAQADAALWSATGGLTTLLTGTQAFANATIAPLFGATGVTGTSLVPVSTNPAQRAGILMHPAIMATLATDTGSHPIKRGVFVWDQIVCQALPDPPPNIPAFPGVPPNSSVRQAFEAFTAPALCQGCHSKINPVGFLFESYDTVGAYRTIDDNGQPVNSQVTIAGALDTTGNPDTTLNVPTPNAVQFVTNLVADGTLTTRCMVTQLYRYALRRMESSADQATISKLATSYTSASQSTASLLGGLAQTPGFLNRLNGQ